MWTTAGRRASATLTTTREKASRASPSSGGAAGGCGSGGVLEPLLIKCCQNRDMAAPCCGVSDAVCILAGGVKRPARSLKGHDDEVFAVVMSPDGRTLATGSADWT